MGDTAQTASNSPEFLISQTCFVANRAQLIPDTSAANALILKNEIINRKKRNYNWKVAYSTIKFNVLLNLDDPQNGKISNFPDLNKVGNKWTLQVMFNVINFKSNIYGIIGNMYNNLVPNNIGWGLIIKDKFLVWYTATSIYELTDLGEIILKKKYSINIKKDNKRYDFELWNMDDNLTKTTFINNATDIITDKGFTVIGGVWDSNYISKQTFLATMNKNPVTYSDRSEVCNYYGSKVATLSQMANAFQDGANWCNPGWVLDDNFPYYPLNSSETGKGNCGFVQGVVKSQRYDVNLIGSNFNKINLPEYNWTSLTMSSDGSVQAGSFISGSETYIAISTDSGQNWSSDKTMAKIVSNSNFPWTCVATNSTGYSLFAAIEQGLIYVSYPDSQNNLKLGDVWYGISSNGNGRWRGIAISEDSSIVALCQQGGPIKISKDAGQTFSNANSTEINATAIAMSSNGKYITVVCAPSPGYKDSPQQSPENVTDDYKILISSDTGTTWKSVNPAKYYYSIAMSASGQIQVTGDYGGDIYISTDYGENWVARTGLPGNKLWTSFSINGNGDIMTACTNGGYFYISTNYGRNWTQKNVSNTGLTNWRCNAISRDGGVILLGSTSGLYLSIYNILDPSFPVNCYGYKMDNKVESDDTKALTPFNSTKWNNPLAESYAKNQIIQIFYTGQPIEIPIKNATKLKIECWGASGGKCNTIPESNGGYSYGFLNVTNETAVYVYVGQRGSDATNTKKNSPGGWNGGGEGTFDGSVVQNNFSGAGGGGATDVRSTMAMWNGNLNDRIIVAGGGGGSSFHNVGGVGGGLIGNDGASIAQSSKSGYGSGGGINAGGNSVGTRKGTPGSSGIGGNGALPGKNFGCGGGGGGWFGGGGGGVRAEHIGDTGAGGGSGAGGGGSSYIGGVVDGATFNKADDGYIFAPDSVQGDGYCVITILETIPVVARQQLAGDIFGLRVLQPNDKAAVNIGATDTNRIFSQGKIFKRECFDCNNNYSIIYYERISPIPANFSIYSMFNQWNQLNNIFDKDFKLYSSFDDLLYKRNAWTSCKFDVLDIGFPGECKPNSSYNGPGQWNSAELNGVKEVKYSLLNIISDIPKTISGLIGWFDGNSWDNINGIWIDKSAAANDTQILTNISNTVNNGFGGGDCSYIYGDNNSKIILKQASWPGIDKDYTFFHVTRYSGNYKGRIWNGVSTDWFSGFEDDSVAYYHGGYLKTDKGLESKNIKDFGNDWVLTTDQNDYVRVYKDYLEFKGSPGKSPSSIGINTGYNTTKPSDWACAEIVIYNRKLNSSEILAVEEYLMDKYQLNIKLQNLLDIREAERQRMIYAEQEAQLAEQNRLYRIYVEQEARIAEENRRYREYIEQEARIAEDKRKYKEYIEQEARIAEDKRKYKEYVEQEAKIAEDKRKYLEYLEQEAIITKDKKFKEFVEEEKRIFLENEKIARINEELRLKYIEEEQRLKLIEEEKQLLLEKMLQAKTEQEYEAQLILMNELEANKKSSEIAQLQNALQEAVEQAKVTEYPYAEEPQQAQSNTLEQQPQTDAVEEPKPQESGNWFADNWIIVTVIGVVLLIVIVGVIFMVSGGASATAGATAIGAEGTASLTSIDST